MLMVFLSLLSGIVFFKEFLFSFYSAFELLHETGNTRYNVVSNNATANSTAGIIVTSNSTHGMIIAYNHNVPLAPIQTESLCINVKGKTEAIAKFNMLGVNPKSPFFDAHIRRIDDDNANPVAAWVAMGSPEYPTAEQINKLWSVSEMQRTHISYTVISSNEVSFAVQVPPEGVAAITFGLH